MNKKTITRKRLLYSYIVIIYFIDDQKNLKMIDYCTCGGFTLGLCVNERKKERNLKINALADLLTR